MTSNNLMPADTYLVVNRTIIHSEDRKLLNMLYQPIIGPIPIMLYYSLWSDLEKNELISEEYNHHHLVSNMHLTLEEITEARKKLEAIGLLKTYFKEGNTNNYLYELFSPIEPNEFFNHPILNVVLYNNLGKKEYEKLKSYFKTPHILKNSFTDITSSFSEVFTPIPMTTYSVIDENLRKYNKLKLNLNINFDFDFLYESIPSTIDKDKLFTKETKELILQMAYLYGLDAIKIQNTMKTCITERNTLNKEEFRKLCRNYYQFENKGSLPSVIYNTQPEYLKMPVGDTSNKSKMIYTFETITPYELLKSKSKNGEPTARDVKLAEDLVVKYGLNPGVVNVLIDYTLKTNNNKLTKNYVETVVGQWQRQNIETVEEAMSAAEKEYKKNKKTKTVKKGNEVIPEWFNKDIKKEEVSQEQKNEMENILKEFR